MFYPMSCLPIWHPVTVNSGKPSKFTTTIVDISQIVTLVINLNHHSLACILVLPMLIR